MRTASDKRRVDKTGRDKKFQEALDKMVAHGDETKKLRTADDKKPGTQAILDAMKWVTPNSMTGKFCTDRPVRNQGDGQAQFLRKLAAEIMEHNSGQHGTTQKTMQNAAREQVGFNLAGYLDDFSKALSVSDSH